MSESATAQQSISTDSTEHKYGINPHQWYDTKEAAQKRGESESMLARERMVGTGPRYRKGTRKVQYLGQWLIDFIDEQVVEPGRKAVGQ